MKYYIHPVPFYLYINNTMSWRVTFSAARICNTYQGKRSPKEGDRVAPQSTILQNYCHSLLILITSFVLAPIL